MAKDDDKKDPILKQLEAVAGSLSSIAEELKKINDRENKKLGMGDDSQKLDPSMPRPRGVM